MPMVKVVRRPGGSDFRRCDPMSYVSAALTVSVAPRATSN
jgi:hypothetical protein